MISAAKPPLSPTCSTGPHERSEPAHHLRASVVNIVATEPQKEPRPEAQGSFHRCRLPQRGQPRRPHRSRDRRIHRNWSGQAPRPSRRKKSRMSIPEGVHRLLGAERANGIGVNRLTKLKIPRRNRWNRSTLARAGADTQRGSQAAVGRPANTTALVSRTVQPRRRSVASARPARNQIWGRAGGFNWERRSMRLSRR
jgi:hypothetical protein